MTPVRANGRYYDHTSLRVSGLPAGLDAEMFTAHVVSANWSETITPSMSKGVHGIALPRGRGSYATSTDLEVVFEAWDAFTKKLASLGYDGYGDFDFDLRLDLKTRGRTSTIIWHEASIVAPGGGTSSGGQAGITMKLGIYTRYITTNGVCAYSLDLDQDVQAALNAAVGVQV